MRPIFYTAVAHVRANTTLKRIKNKTQKKNWEKKRMREMRRSDIISGTKQHVDGPVQSAFIILDTPADSARVQQQKKNCDSFHLPRNIRSSRSLFVLCTTEAASRSNERMEKHTYRLKIRQHE